MLDLAIINGQIISDGQVFDGDLGIEGDRIVLVATTGALPAASKTIDAKGLLVLPGAIDAHFHCRAPAYPERGDFTSETQAAAAGGVTTVLEMPISKPGCATPEILRARRELGEKTAHVNFGLFGAPGTLRREDVLGMAEEGAIGYKIFMHSAPPGRADEFLGLCIPNDGDLFKALALVKETGLGCTVHAESDDLLESQIRELKAEGRKDLAAHGASRPPIVEAVAIARLIAFCEALHVPIHIAHLSTALGLKLLRQAQASEIPMTAEVCTHHLLFDEERMLEAGPFAKINPPLRQGTDIEAMWDGVLDGSIGIVVTDHSPFRPAEKEVGWDDIWAAVSGCPGVEMLVPVMLNAALQGQIDLPKAVDLISSAPARLYHLYPHKGRIAAGSDADITLFDPTPSVWVDSSKWFTRARDCDRLYSGMQMRGQVVTTVVNGQICFANGEVRNSPGDGRFVRPAL